MFYFKRFPIHLTIEIGDQSTFSLKNSIQLEDGSIGLCRSNFVVVDLECFQKMIVVTNRSPENRTNRRTTATASTCNTFQPTNNVTNKLNQGWFGLRSTCRLVWVAFFGDKVMIWVVFLFVCLLLDWYCFPLCPAKMTHFTELYELFFGAKWRLLAKNISLVD